MKTLNFSRLFLLVAVVQLSLVTVCRAAPRRGTRDSPPGSPESRGLLGGPPGSPGPVIQSGGQVYTRWGRTTCPSTSGIELVYSGRVGGSYYNHGGGGANYVCMHDDPQYYSGTSSRTYSRIYGSEYEFVGGRLGDLTNHNVPCVVCEVSTRSKYLMIPGRYTCPSSWTREYKGYLMAESNGNHRTEFICVDYDPEQVAGRQGHQAAADMYPVRAACGGIACPPYNSDNSITCVVCTK